MLKLFTLVGVVEIIGWILGRGTPTTVALILAALDRIKDLIQPRR